MFVTTTRNALLVLALSLTFLGSAARPARARTFTRAEVRKLLKIRFAQATAVFHRIQKEQQMLASFPGSFVQTALTQDQSVLVQIQAQISLLKRLLADLNLAFAIDRMIQKVQKQAGGKRKEHHHDCDDDHHDRKGQSKPLNGIARRAKIADLQAALSQVQADISNLESQIIP